MRILLGPMQRPEEACEVAKHSGNEAALRQAADYLLQAGHHEVSLMLLSHAMWGCVHRQGVSALCLCVLQMILGRQHDV